MSITSQSSLFTNSSCRHLIGSFLLSDATNVSSEPPCSLSATSSNLLSKLTLVALSDASSWNKKSKFLGACLSSKYLTVNRVGNLPLKQGKAHCTSDKSNQSESDNVSKVGEVAAAMGVSRSVPTRSSIINSRKCWVNRWKTWWPVLARH